jgi:hypothetical protein
MTLSNATRFGCAVGGVVASSARRPTRTRSNSPLATSGRPFGFALTSIPSRSRYRLCADGITSGAQISATSASVRYGQELAPCMCAPRKLASKLEADFMGPPGGQLRSAELIPACRAHARHRQRFGGTGLKRFSTGGRAFEPSACRRTRTRTFESIGEWLSSATNRRSAQRLIAVVETQ